MKNAKGLKVSILVALIAGKFALKMDFSVHKANKVRDLEISPLTSFGRNG